MAKAHKNWIDYKKTLGNQLTDNVRANEILSPVYMALIFFIIKFNYPYFSNFKIFCESLISALIYIYASNYFQPDLDIHTNRPGMGHFPLGRWIGVFRFGRFLKWFIYPINRIWYYLWHPYGNLMTHRGFGHWPVLGVILRILYLWCFIIFIKFFVIKFGIGYKIIYFSETWFKSFLPWDKNFGIASIFWIKYTLPIYISDIIHFIVDYRDSYKKGISFCPPKIPRGIIAALFQQVRESKPKKKKR